ncbi:MAG TPA: amidohydrolase family protein [Candidatus Obscuribacterales bacterium]
MLKRTTIVVAVVGLLSSAAVASAETLAVKAGRLVDTESGQVLVGQTILIENDRITKVGDSKSMAVPAGASVIDLTDETVLPGLIDCHTHLLDETESDPIVELQKSGAEKALEAIPHAKRTLAAGFTTVRDVGTFHAFTDVALRDAIARGEVVGPRMFVCGAYLTTTGGGGSVTGLATGIELPKELRFGQADSPWEARKVVRELAHHNVDLIKVIATGAVLAHNSNPAGSEFTFEELQAAVDEANRFGLKVAAHAHGAQGIKDAVRAGVASIEHGTDLDDEGIALMKKHGTYLVADVYDDEYIQGDAKLKGMPGDFLKHEAVVAQIQRDNFAKAVKAGVKIAFGTDAGVFPHGQNARQFAWMVRYGMTPMQAIQSATINAADLIGQRAILGSVATGKKADLVAVKGDPTHNVSQLEHIDFVMKDGAVFRGAGAH